MDFVDGWGRHVSTSYLTKSFQTELVRGVCYEQYMNIDDVQTTPK